MTPAPSAGDSAQERMPASECPEPVMTSQPARRGSAHQQPRRHREHAARRHAAATGKRLVEHGKHWREVARRFRISARTLRRWCLLQETAPNRGRPVIHSPRDDRNALLHLLDEYGPGVGLPTLKDCFPHMLRAEQEDLLRRYRRVWRERHRIPLRVLHWSEPGRVWAVDFAEAPVPIDGRFRYLLAVRDLASGTTLLWQPVEHATGDTATALLAGLFATHGAPLVLKSDNGSHFDNSAVQDLLRMWNVAHLFSPPRWPRYNGAIEAGIGSLKARTESAAARHGRPGAWTWDDAAAAMVEANLFARPRGERGPSPEQLWTDRTKIDALERARFMDCVGRHREASKPVAGSCGAEEPEVQSMRGMARQAIRLALEECGYLTYTRRRIPPPIPRRKADIIP